MGAQVAEKIVDFIFAKTPLYGKIDIGYFGGEPLLEFDQIKYVTNLIKRHPEAAGHQIEFQIVSNGTIFSDEIATYISDMQMSLVISCDGPPFVQNIHRRFSDGKSSSGIVESTITKAKSIIGAFMVNAVYTPQTFRYLPETVDYLYGLGVRNIFLNPDYSACWSVDDINEIPGVFEKVGEKYVQWYLQNDPALVSFIDSKISLMINNGCSNSDKCHMGTREFAFTPDGKIFPCERLVFDGGENGHCIGDIYSGVDFNKFHFCSRFSKNVNQECLNCTLRKYCMNWCGCSNYFSTKYYDRVSPFTCANEKAAITVALNVFKQLSNQVGPTLIPRLLQKQFIEYRV
jgi:uncharacterized protein